MIRTLLVSIAALTLATLTSLHSAKASEPEQRLEHASISVRMSDGLNLAAYVTRPTGVSDALPALFLTQSVACRSIAPVAERMSRHEELALAAGWALIRVERAGMGESEGAGCDQLDYNTEVAHYREAFDQVIEHPWVDKTRVVIIGNSLGSTTAPLVAQDKPIIGVIVQGGGALSYFERMVYFDRQQLERSDTFSPSTIDEEMRRRMAFHREYLLAKKTPETIARERPELAGVWQSLFGTDAAPHYGRPYAWHWQAAEQNWLAAWAKLEVPTMVVYGEYEQFESRYGHRVIVDLVNRLRPGTAAWVEIPKAGHTMAIYPDRYAAYQWRDHRLDPDAFIQPVKKWLERVGAQ